MDKPEIKKTVVVYSGRFQPFHKGHYAAYQKLVSKFGANNVYIGTSDKTDGGKSPFNFKEKVVIMGKMFGIPPSKIVRVSNPYAPKEILSKFDGKTTAYIAAVGEKDATRLAGKYFKPYKGKTGYGYEEIGYTYIIPSDPNPISGTDVRSWLSSDKAEKLFLKAYPKFDKEIYNMITKKLVKEEFVKGYPSKEDVKKIQKKNDNIRSVATTDDSYVYDPIAEQIAKLVFEADNFIEEYFLEEEPNPVMDKEIQYTAADGKKKKITVRGALRLPKDHEAHIQASKLVGPDDAPANEPNKKAETPPQPGQPVKKGDTAQGKIDSKPKGDGGEAGKEQGPPPEQKLKGAELKSSAEDRVSKEKKAQEVKTALDNEIKSLNKEEQDFIDKGEHKQGSKFMNSLKDGIKKVADTKVVKAIGHVLQHKAEMVKGSWDGVKALASGQKIGSTKNKETGEWEYSDDKRKEQIHHMKHFAKDVALLVGSVALGSGLAAGAKALAAGSGIGGAASAVGSGAVGAFTHGAGGFAAHLGKDAVKHVALEAMGLGGTQAAVGGAGLAGATMGLLEIRSLITEEEMNTEKFIQNVVNKMAEKMETFEMSDEQLLQSIKSYKQGKDFGDLVKEDVSVDVDKGDEVLMGKFKNKKVTVKDIGTDGHGMPTINGKQATTFRTLSEIQKGFFKGKIKIGGQPVEVEVELVGADNKNREFVTKVIGIDKKYQNKLPIGSTLPIPARLFRHGGWVKVKVPSAFNEVGSNDWHYKAIMKLWDKASSFGRKKIGVAVCNDPNASRREVERSLRDTDYEEVTDMSDKLGLKEGLNISEQKKSKAQIIGEFIKFAKERLELKSYPNKIKLIKDENFPKQVKSFGGYDPQTDEIFVYAGNNRNIVDVVRTLAHELVHLKQRQEGRIGGPEEGATGSDIENEANAAAGILLRDFGRRNQYIYEVSNVATANTADVPDGSFIKKGKKRKLDTDKSEDWYENGGYTQTDFPKADAIFGDDDAEERTIKYTIKNLPTIEYTPTEFIKEATASEVIKDLDKVRTDLIKKVDILISKKKKLYSDVDITTPMSADEKKLDKDIQDIFSQIQQLIQQKRKIKNESINELTNNEKRIKDGNPSNVYYAFYKGKFEAVYWAMNPSDLFNIYWDEFKVRRPAGSKFKLNPEFIIVPKKEYDKNPNQYSKLKPYVDKFWDKLQNESVNESLLVEGGAYGHMNHPFDISMNLTFGDLKKIINNALDGKLGVVREKTDGQALAISWKNGKLIAARNKGHLANGGASALDMSALASKFGGRGALSDAYNFAMRDLSAAISGLGEKERQSIFKDGSAFCNLEVIYPENANVIPYGQSLLIFHNVVEYDEKGNAVGAVKGAESKLASMIKQTNAHVQSKYTLQGPPITKLPKDEKLSSQKSKFNGMLSKLQSEFNLSDKDGVAEYHYAWWMNFVNKSKKNLAQLEKEGLARRWAFDNKSFGIKSIADEDARKWADGVDKDAKDKIMKGNLRKFEDIFLGVGAEVLSFMSSVLTAQPDKALQSIKASLESSISDIRNGGSEAQIKRLEKELARLNAIGGFEKLVPNEGLVFFYKGNTYKLTGAFAPLNQILGIFKFGR